jgi:hypothetical protein
MEFLQPYLLWGILGLAIPVLIHLWNGQRGVVLPWAAMEWLKETENQASKSIRIEQWLLLFLRMLFLALLVVFLAQLFLKSKSEPEIGEVIHLVQPDVAVLDQYRFELEQAISKDEKVLLASEGFHQIGSLDEVDQILDRQDFKLQRSLDELPSNLRELNLYLVNTATWQCTSYFKSPVKPKLYLTQNSRETRPKNYMETEEGNFGFVNQQGLLTFSSERPQMIDSVIRKGDFIKVHFDQIPIEDRTYLQASLEAISEVYPLRFESVEDIEMADLAFSGTLPGELDSMRLYFLLDPRIRSVQQNVVVFHEKISKSDWVWNGQLPEWILEHLMLHLGIQRKEVPMSLEQMQRKFLVSKPENSAPKGNSAGILLTLLVVTFAAERALSQQKQL